MPSRNLVRNACTTIVFLLALPLAVRRAEGQAVPVPISAARITQPIDDTQLVRLPGNVHPLASARYDEGGAPAATPTGRIQIVFRRSAAQQQALAQYLADLQNSNSPNYHKWLTPAQYGTAFGINDSDLQKVEGWLQSHGFTIDRVPQARNLIQFSGSFGQVESAFHSSMHVYQVSGKRHYANATDPMIPAALSPVVAGVAQLNDFYPTSQSQPGVNGQYNASTKTIEPTFTLFSGTTPLLYTDPADAATIYDTPNAALNPNYSGTTYDGTGVNIGIAGDSNVTLSYITNYRVAFLGEAAATANIPTVVIDGNDPGVNGDQTEGLLDNEIAGGLAPKAHIYFYTSSNTDLQAGLFDAISRAIDDNVVSILNISFGECEANLGTAANAVILELNEQAAAQGISVVVSSGDSGSAGCDSSGSSAAQYGLAVNGLASSPFNVAVGGNDFDVLLTNFSTYVEDANSGSPPYYRTVLSYIPENPWNDSTTVNTAISDNSATVINGATNVIAGGGGASAAFPKPSFQTALTLNDSARDLPDVSFLAANGFYAASWVVCASNITGGPDCQTSGGQFVDGATFSGYGGTSTAAPAFSGILALVEQKVGSRLGQADYVLYQLASSHYASVFHDVTVGDNSVYCQGGALNCGNNNFLTGFNAGAGYDQATGLGSVDATALANNWNSVALTPTATAFTLNGSTSPISVAHGTSLAFNVGVTPAAATGVVGIVDTANEVPGGPQNNGQLSIGLSSGSGSATYNGLPGGTYTVYARYGGDATDAASTSTPAINVTIAPEESSTALTASAYSPATGSPIAGGLSAVPYGSYLFLDAQVYGTAEGETRSQGLATGSVAFADGGEAIAQAPISASNTASYPPIDTQSYPAYSVGAHSMVARYPGDASYSASTSVAVPFSVVKGYSNVTATASSNAIPSDATVTLSVSVWAASLGAGPTGTVTVTSNGKTLDTFTQLSGAAGSPQFPAISRLTAIVQGSQLAEGNNTITMTYSGDGNYTGSTGSVVINVSPSKFTLANSGPLSIAAGATTGNTVSIVASPINSFVGTINLSCAVTTEPASAASPANCTVPASLSLTSSAPVSSSLVVGTTAATTPGAYVIAVTGTDAATRTIIETTNVNVSVTPAPVNPSFTLTNSGSLTIAPGATSGNTATITVTPSGGFAATVNLSCAVTTAIVNPSYPVTCTLPSSVTVTGATGATATLTVNSTSATTTAQNAPMHRGFAAVGGAFFAMTMFFCVPFRRRRWGHLAALLGVVLFASAIGCGGSGSQGTSKSGNPGTTAGTYVVTITGSSAGVTTQATTVSVNVN
jgi:trimeric autotransporter adhesin